VYNVSLRVREDTGLCVVETGESSDSLQNVNSWAENRSDSLRNVCVAGESLDNLRKVDS
jgi:hypothetical protein